MAAWMAADPDTARPTTPTAALRGCRAVDGDTIRCRGERIRLLGIDAPEMPGHCRRERRCAPGDPSASKAALQRALTGEVRLARYGTDRYGRTLALVSVGGLDLSCAQLAAGLAVYRRDWDDNDRVAAICPAAAQPR